MFGDSARDNQRGAAGGITGGGAAGVERWAEAEQGDGLWREREVCSRALARAPA